MGSPCSASSAAALGLEGVPGAEQQVQGLQPPLPASACLSPGAPSSRGGRKACEHWENLGNPLPWGLPSLAPGFHQQGVG